MAWRVAWGAGVDAAGADLDRMNQDTKSSKGGASGKGGTVRGLALGACVLALLAGTALAGGGGGGGGSGTPAKATPAKPAAKAPVKPAAPALPQVMPVSLETPAAKGGALTDHDDGGAASGARGDARADGHGASAAPAKPATGPTTAGKAPAARGPVKSGGAAKPASAGAGTGGDEIDGGLSPEQALAALQEGNMRWMSGTPSNPATGMLRRQTTASEGQHPFVTVLTCADSRVPVERVFDRGVGEVFVVRVAGNIADRALTGTVEYGVGYLGTKLLVVMGHAKCHAVKATVESTQAGGAGVGPNFAEIVETIRPAVDRAKRLNPEASGDALVEAAVRENVWQTVFDLYKGSPALAGAAQRGELKVIGAVLDVSTGKVEWLGEHPWQDALVAALAKPEAQAVKPAAEAGAKAHGGGSAGESAAGGSSADGGPDDGHKQSVTAVPTDGGH